MIKLTIENFRDICTISVGTTWKHKDNSLIAHQSFVNEKPYDATYVLTSFITF